MHKLLSVCNVIKMSLTLTVQQLYFTIYFFHQFGAAGFWLEACLCVHVLLPVKNCAELNRQAVSQCANDPNT